MHKVQNDRSIGARFTSRPMMSVCIQPGLSQSGPLRSLRRPISARRRFLRFARFLILIILSRRRVSGLTRIGLKRCFCPQVVMTTSKMPQRI